MMWRVLPCLFGVRLFSFFVDVGGCVVVVVFVVLLCCFFAAALWMISLFVSSLSDLWLSLFGGKGLDELEAVVFVVRVAVWVDSALLEFM